MWTIKYGNDSIGSEGNAYAALRVAGRYFALKDFAREAPTSNDGVKSMVLRISDDDSGFSADVVVNVSYEVSIAITKEPEIEHPEVLAETVGLSKP